MDCLPPCFSQNCSKRFFHSLGSSLRPYAPFKSFNKGLNLLVGGRPKPEPDKETDLEAWFAWSEVSQM